MTTDPKVDLYIDKAQPFALPILLHLRKLIHKACPEVTEAIKWSRPFFLYKGVILCNISAFKEHCSFGFWGQEMADELTRVGALQPGAMGSLGRITSLKDLPADKLMLGWIRQAAASIDKGEQQSPMAARIERNKVVKAPKKAVAMPPAFEAALKRNAKASDAFAAFSPSCKREYIEWIADAKRDATRDSRIATALEWIAEGKQRNWKYQNC